MLLVLLVLPALSLLLLDHAVCGINPDILRASKLQAQLDDLRRAVATLGDHQPAEEQPRQWNPRRHSADLHVPRRVHNPAFTARDFYRQYEATGRPLVVEDNHPNKATWSASNATWDLPWWRRHCGDGRAVVRVSPARKNNGTAGAPPFWEWASVPLPLANYIDFLTGNLSAAAAGFPRPTTRPCETYLFDWPISQCPGSSVLDDVIVPRIFANDMLTLCDDCPYAQGDWPSLFIGPPGMRASPLHRDTFGSAFWSIMISGFKTWHIFAAEDAPFLYPSLRDDVRFDVIDALDSDDDTRRRFPMVRLAGSATVTIGPGDLLYIPAGSPHQVVSDGDEATITVMLAMNFVQTANLRHVIETTAPVTMRSVAAAPDAPEEWRQLRNYAPLHAFFKHHKRLLEASVDWDVGPKPWRRFAARALRKDYCPDRVPYSVDGRVYEVFVPNTMSPDVRTLARVASRRHPGVAGLEASLFRGIVQELRKRAHACRNSSAVSQTWFCQCAERRVAPRVWRDQRSLVGLCPSYAMAEDFATVPGLVLPPEALRLIAWASDCQGNTNCVPRTVAAGAEAASSAAAELDSVDDMPAFTTDLGPPALPALARVMGVTEGALLNRLAARLLPALRGLPCARGDLRLRNDGAEWLQSLLHGNWDQIYGFVRQYSPGTRPSLMWHRDAAQYSVNIALNSYDEFEGGNLLLALGGRGERGASLSPERRGKIGCGVVIGPNVPHAVSPVHRGTRWSLVLFFSKLRDYELPQCFVDFGLDLESGA